MITNVLTKKHLKDKVDKSTIDKIIEFVKDLLGIGGDKVSDILRNTTFEFISEIEESFKSAEKVKPKDTSEIDEKLAVIENELRQIIDSESKSKINIYAGTNENADLSNFATRPFTFKGYQFNSVEAAFQAMKIEKSVPIDIDNSEIMDKLTSKNVTGAQAKSLGRQIKGLDVRDWDRKSSSIMEQLLLASFEQNPKSLERLLSTGNAELTHTQDKGKWGREFPKLLMKVRDELRQSKPEVKKVEVQKPQQANFMKSTIEKIFSNESDESEVSIQNVVDNSGSKVGFKIISDDEAGDIYAVVNDSDGKFIESIYMKDGNLEGFANEISSRYKQTNIEESDLDFSEVKEGVDFVFEQTPELSKIGNEQLYSQYLNTIFPDSKVKDIVYRGDVEELGKFSKIDSKGNYKSSEYGFNYGIFLSSDIDYVDREYGKSYSDKNKIYPAVINSSNILEVSTPLNMEVTAKFFLSNELDPTDNDSWLDLSDEEKEVVYSEYLKNKDKNHIDTIIGNDSDSQGLSVRSNINGLEYVVYNADQIYILGSKQDIEGFKKFIESNSLLTDDLKQDLIKKHGSDAIEVFNSLTEEEQMAIIKCL
jgi:ribA/ribD-fused uncharacterized protein